MKNTFLNSYTIQFSLNIGLMYPIEFIQECIAFIIDTYIKIFFLSFSFFFCLFLFPLSLSPFIPPFLPFLYLFSRWNLSFWIRMIWKIQCWKPLPSCSCQVLLMVQTSGQQIQKHKLDWKLYQKQQVSLQTAYVISLLNFPKLYINLVSPVIINV